MRIALLSAIAENPDQAGERMAFRQFVGRSVLAHQIDAMLALGCESIICIASGLNHDLIACQHRCEKGGARFHSIDASRRLSGLVTAKDEVFVLADGLLLETGGLVEALAKRSAILTFPADTAITKGFERIDSELAWAGAMRVHGSAVERLSDLPPDVDAVSALLRIALQSGTHVEALDEALLTEGRWSLQDNYTVRIEREKAWVKRYVRPASFAAPGTALTERIGARLARDFVGGKLQKLPLVMTVLSGAFGAGFAASGRVELGLVFALGMVILERIGGVFERLIEAGKPNVSDFSVRKFWRIGSDALLCVLLALNLPETLGWARVFMPILLIGLLRLGERKGLQKWRATYADRVLQIAILLVPAFLGYLYETMAIGSLLLLATIFLEQNEPDTNP